MEKTFDTILTIAFVICLMIISYIGGINDGYKVGQVDAINGEIHYHLEKQPNGEMEWVKIK